MKLIIAFVLFLLGQNIMYSQKIDPNDIIDVQFSLEQKDSCIFIAHFQAVAGKSFEDCGILQKLQIIAPHKNSIEDIDCILIYIQYIA